MAIAFSTVAGHANASNTNAPTITVNIGDCVVVMAAITASSMTVSSVADTGSNTYTKQATSSNGSTLPDIELWTTIATAGATSVTVTFSTSGNNGVAVATYTGVAAIGSAFTNTGSSTTIDSGTQTVSSASDFLVAMLAEAASQTMTAQNGTLRGQQAVNASTGRIGVVDNTGSTSLDCSVTLGVSEVWAAISVDLKASATTFKPEEDFWNDPSVFVTQVPGTITVW